MSLTVRAYVRWEGSQNSSMAGNRFTGINCAVSTPHVEITCLTEQGAGSSYWLDLVVDDQQSVVATTTYAIPSIISIDGPGSNQAIEDGNQLIYIHGKNFGPNRTSPNIAWIISRVCDLWRARIRVQRALHSC